MRKNKFTMLCSLLALVLATVCLAPAAKANHRLRQGQTTTAAKPVKAPTPSETLLRAWSNVSKRLIDMAEDFPQDKYGFRPTPEVRSFGQVLLHIAGSNYFYMSRVRGTKGADEDLSADKYKTKAEIVAALKKSFADGAELIKQTGDAGVMNNFGTWLQAVEHSGEHFGQLVVYFRLNGIVPPTSRPRPKA